MDGKREDIAIIGGGVTGIVAAWLLSRRHNVTLMEKNDYLGGHTHTIELKEGPDALCCVDTGFIVFNERTYPNFIKFLSVLGVEGRDSEMSFSYWDDDRQFGYAGTSLNGLFAQRKNLFRPSFWRMLLEIHRFGQQASEEVKSDKVPAVTLGEYLEMKRFAPEFIEWYILPMGAAIWSMPVREMMRYPAANLLRFLANHGLLSLENRPRWKTVRGGSWTYVQAFQRQFNGRVILNAQVESVRRSDEGAWVKIAGGERRYDRVVLACHADEALSLLQDATALERELLTPWRYTPNKTVLHNDISALPPLRRCWASWNYRRMPEGKDTPLILTYHMNRLQGLKTQLEYCVTLNGPYPLQGHPLAEMTYHHPNYNSATWAAQERLQALQGERTWFCGSYFGYGFHEDAVRSAAAVGRAFGVEL